MPGQHSDYHFLPTLDGWRAVAISMVVLSHCVPTGSGNPIFRLGTFGVMLFFAISGFLICTRLLIEEEKRGNISLRSFYIRRIFRILPPAYAYLASVLLLAVTGVLTVSSIDITGAAFFFGNYVPSQSWFTGHFWSLAIEEHFYLFWPAVLAALGRRRAIGVAAALIVLAVVLRQLTVAQLPAGSDLPGYTQLRLDAFMFPCILAILLRNGQFADRFAIAETPHRWFMLAMILGVGIVLGTRVPGWREPLRLFQSAVLPVLIVTTVQRPNDWMGRALRQPPLEWLGRISYSVYLWQQLVFGLAPSARHARILSLPFLLLAILGLAVLSRRWIEEPMIALGRKLAVPRQPVQGRG